MRLRVLLACLLVNGCTAPAWKNFSSGIDDDGSTGASTGTGTSSTSSTGGGESTGGGSSSGESSSGVDTGSGSAGTTSTTTGSSAGSTTTTGAASTGTSGGEAFCGDGVVAGEEECDDGNTDWEDGCNQICKRDRVVFTTSEQFPSDLIGGLAGADGICRQLAAAADLPNAETFTAWLSDSHTDAIDRVFRGDGRYIRPDGAVIAKNFFKLMEGPLLVPIEIDEHGEFAGGGAWTGTLPNGQRVPNSKHCLDWTTDDLFIEKGYFGSCVSTDSWWTYVDNPMVSPSACSGQEHLYCFEGK